MSEFFLEVFTEEIPAKLQNDARNSLSDNFKKLFEEKKIKYKSSKVFSVPNRLVILFDGLNKQIIFEKEEKRGPSTKSPKEALDGFLRSNKITEKEVYFIETLFLSTKPLNKNFILENVWKYSKGTDTHTVETHIYRLRQKIKNYFNDNNFIKHTDKGYSI